MKREAVFLRQMNCEAAFFQMNCEMNIDNDLKSASFTSVRHVASVANMLTVSVYFPILSAFKQ